jgi:hypothetical protein
LGLNNKKQKIDTANNANLWDILHGLKEVWIKISGAAA